MTPVQAKALLESPVFKAFAEGKQVQFDTFDLPALSPYTLVEQPDRYRIKPEPMDMWFFSNRTDDPICMNRSCVKPHHSECKFIRHFREVI